MDPKTRLAQLNKEADALIKKADETPDDFTQADSDRSREIYRERKALSEQISKVENTSKALAGVGIGQPTQGGEETPDDVKGWSAGGSNGAAKTHLGRTAKTAAFTEGVTDAFAKASGTVGGPAVKKALVPNGAIAAPFDGTIVRDPHAAFSLIAAVNGRPVNTPSGTYLRQILRDNQAAPVQSGNLKPISKYGLEPAKWEVSTIAHLTDPVQMQWLEDYDGLVTFIGSEMAYGLEEEVAAYILHGGVTEDGNTAPGVLNTTGVGQTDFKTNEMLTIRSALTELETTGIDSTGIVMNPTDWEKIETTTTTDGEFLLPQAPQASPTRTLWNVPVTLVPAMPAGQALVGDLTTISLLWRSGMQLVWFQSGTTNTGTDAAPVQHDLTRRNQGVFRGELRVGLEILSPPVLRVADLTAAV